MAVVPATALTVTTPLPVHKPRLKVNQGAFSLTLQLSVPPRIADAHGLGRRIGTALRRTEGEAQRTRPDGRRRDWWRCDRRGCTGGRRNRRRSPGWCEGREIALGRLIVGNVIGRNEVVLRHGRPPNIETCLRSQRGESSRLARCLSAGVAGCIDRRDILRGPVHCWRSTSTWQPMRYSTTTQAPPRWLLPNSYGYPHTVLAGSRHTLPGEANFS